MPGQKMTIEQVIYYLNRFEKLSPMELQHLKMKLDLLGEFVDLENAKWGSKSADV